MIVSWFGVHGLEDHPPIAAKVTPETTELVTRVQNDRSALVLPPGIKKFRASFFSLRPICLKEGKASGRSRNEGNSPESRKESGRSREKEKSPEMIPTKAFCLDWVGGKTRTVGTRRKTTTISLTLHPHACVRAFGRSAGQVSHLRAVCRQGKWKERKKNPTLVQPSFFFHILAGQTPMPVSASGKHSCLKRPPTQFCRPSV